MSLNKLFIGLLFVVCSSEFINARSVGYGVEPIEQYQPAPPPPPPQQPPRAPVQSYAPAPQPSYGYDNAPQMRLKDVQGSCLSGSVEVILYEGDVVGETYCRCDSGSYGKTCLENIQNPCLSGQQYHPADPVFGEHYFVECNWEIPYVFRCPADLVWNHQILSCDYVSSGDSYSYNSYSQPSYSQPQSYQPAPPAPPAVQSYAPPAVIREEPSYQPAPPAVIREEPSYQPAPPAVIREESSYQPAPPAVIREESRYQPAPQLPPRAPVQSYAPQAPPPQLPPRAPVQSYAPQAPPPQLPPRAPVQSYAPQVPVQSVAPRAPVSIPPFMSRPQLPRQSNY